MAGKGPLTDAEKQQIRALRAEGKGRNEIRKALGRSSGTITNFCKAEGLSFDVPPQTKQAVAARTDRLRTSRSEIAAELLTDVLTLKTKIINAEDGTDAKGWAIAMGICIDKHLALVRHDADPGTDAARAMLTQLAEAIGVAAQLIDGPPAQDAP